MAQLKNAFNDIFGIATPSARAQSDVGKVDIVTHSSSTKPDAAKGAPAVPEDELPTQIDTTRTVSDGFTDSQTQTEDVDCMPSERE